jgi:hypothetical protein
MLRFAEEIALTEIKARRAPGRHRSFSAQDASITDSATMGPVRPLVMAYGRLVRLFRRSAAQPSGKVEREVTFDMS